MTRSPLTAAAVLAAGLLVAACGSPPAAHGGAPKGKATPSPSAKALSPAAAAEAGFKAWAAASVILTGGSPAGMPSASYPAAEADVMALGRVLKLPGWLHTLGHGQVLTETPPGCQAALWTVLGAFVLPANAPNSTGTGPVGLVVRGGGIACATEAGGEAYMAIKASASPVTDVLLGSLVSLPPVPGLPRLPRTIFRTVWFGSCSSAWLQAAEQGPLYGRVPGCPAAG